jgi:hypothetical protein
MEIQVMEIQALESHKAHARHLKQFNQGIELFNTGVSCPKEESPLKDGWLCGQQLRAVRVAALAESQSKHL